MQKIAAQEFGHKWVEAWNSHNIDNILRHYTQDFEFESPIIKLIAKNESGKLKGKEAVKAYWLKALAINPDLKFELICTMAGVNSVVVHYKGHRGLCAEVFFFNEVGQVSKSYAHYE